MPLYTVMTKVDEWLMDRAQAMTDWLMDAWKIPVYRVVPTGFITSVMMLMVIPAVNQFMVGDYLTGTVLMSLFICHIPSLRVEIRFMAAMTRIFENGDNVANPAREGNGFLRNLLLMTFTLGCLPLMTCLMILGPITLPVWMWYLVGNLLYLVMEYLSATTVKPPAKRHYGKILGEVPMT